MRKLLNSSRNRVRHPSDREAAVIHEAIGTLAPAMAEKPPLLVSSLRSLFEGEMPNLFDWYIGMVSILLGCSMFLFNRYLVSDQIIPYLLWLIPIRISFIAAGAGVLILGFFQREHTARYRSIHVLLSLTYLLFALILWQTGEWDGGALYGLTGLAIILTLFLGAGGVIGFFVYALLLLAILPISLAAGGGTGPISSILTYLHWPLPVSSAAWLAIVGSIALGTLGSYRRHHMVFRFSLSLVIIGHLLLSLWYGANMAWGQSLLLSLLSGMVLLVPQWRMFPFEQRWMKITICSTCLGVFLTLSLALFITHLMQKTMLTQAKTDLMNTATYGGIMLTTTIENIRTSMESMSKNPALREAIIQRNETLLGGLSRGLFESHRTILRVGFLDTDGLPLALYPPFNRRDVTFIHEPSVARALSGASSLSTITTMNGNTQIPVISIAVPIHSADQTIIGAAVGMVDLYALTDLLQQSASSEKEEYIMVTDRSGRQIIHPNITLIGTAAQAAQGSQDGASLVEGYTQDGKRVMQADIPLTALSMRITVNQPMTTALPVGIMISFLLVCTAIVYTMIAGMNAFCYIRREVRRNGQTFLSSLTRRPSQI